MILHRSIKTFIDEVWLGMHIVHPRELFVSFKILSSMHIVVISGSPREQSISKRIALHLVNRLNQSDIDQVSLIDIRTEALPPVQAVWNKEELIPEDKKEVFGIMDQATGFILVSPEYNGGYSSVMKNFLDHFPKRIFHRKTWGVTTGSTGAMGGIRASQQMQLLGGGFSAIVCPRMLITPHMDKKFDQDGRLTDDTFDQQVELFLSEFLWLTDRVSSR